ncbi:MAG: hypothetical protein Q4G24_12975 [Paracoccus sp. (in: a-proteobacteria)]|uniref:hypothetical protein n=1 Tax=Paracoccus sp. TaxID=267 RepID=UPI0026DED3B8|nr:hypothetical protein [Paracoccus sp. (in: a-proteobacteria)]MDO5622372.1 hypothetical protein [Paracoccus sp. (in: a-proteobacteria)]
MPHPDALLMLPKAVAAATLLALTACGDNGDYPALLPTAEILAEPAIPAGGNNPAAREADLRAQGQAVQAQAQATRDAGLADTALPARARALQSRAEALRQTQFPASTPAHAPDTQAPSEPGAVTQDPETDARLRALRDRARGLQDQFGTDCGGPGQPACAPAN